MQKQPKNKNRDWTKSHRVMPIATLLLSTLVLELSCSQRPVLLKIDHSDDLLPVGPPPNESDGDPLPPTPVTPAPIPAGGIPVSMPVTPVLPMPMPGVPKFVACTE
ncbi:MAG: hypothetical protein H7318_01200, partial [Oligoflexus sp.]|nr:hypothetical protein [Oligoflexus sp.]